VVVITAFEQTQFLMRAITIGVDRYVMKPVQPELLESALLHCAHQLRAEEELRQHLRVERDLALARHHEALCILAKGIAHDYNNLLQAILTSVETALLQTPAGSPAHLILGLTQRFTDLAQQLGQQLLALGNLDDQFDHRGSLAPLLQRVLNEAIKGTGIVAKTAFPADFPSVRYNGERLAHAITLLLANAREAMPQGGSLELSAELRACTAVASPGEPAPGTYLHVGIKDSGVGISVELLPRIFDPYFSSKALGSKKGQGLSLALCRSIILAHSGFITAESKVGEGSTFHIYLPVDPPTAA
jgi:signal transduction histidine kinase